LIDIQAQRDRLGQLQHDVEFRAEELNARERAAEQAKLKSKLTFSDMTVLDKAFPPVEPAFPKPFIVMPVGIAAGLALGLILALLAEAADRRVRFPIDLEYATPAPFLGAIGSTGRAKGRIGASRRALRPA
jgi:succinoglycan biosynthesis transport protein ExoP